MREKDAAGINILVISEHTNPDKIKRHIGPLASVVNQTTMVCLTPNHDVDIEYIQTPSFGFRLLGIAFMFLVAIRESISNDYDLVVSFSLFPYGLYALTIGAVTGIPTHLGIIGADLDVHAHAWYRWIPIGAFRQFDSISVLGSEHRNQLIEYKIAASDVFVLTNAINTNLYSPDKKDIQAIYDFIWSGRFAPEKDPILFVKAVHELQKRGHDVHAVMLGSGELSGSVKAAVTERCLADAITLPGWVEEPAEYYAQSRMFVLTSKREALGLSLIESMAMGLACVTPKVGNIPDIATDEENALLVNRRDTRAFADAMERLITDEDLRKRLASNATPVGQSFSYENAEEDWREIVEYSV